MAKTKKSWQEKLKESHGLPKAVEITSKMAGRREAKLGDLVKLRITSTL